MNADMYIAGHKVITDTVPVALIRIIRKYKTGPIGAIKNDIEKQRYVLSCSLIGEREKFDELIRCHDELIRSGYTVEMYDNGRKTDIQFFRNWSDSMRQTAEEVMREWEEEFADEDDG